ncbi:MAG: type II toxin-antitoxin system HicB family antitoxin [Terracidiphilus sp.]
MKQKFLVVYEHGKRNYGGFAPDIPGCISTAKTLTEIRRLMREALEGHLEFMAADSDSMPSPVTTNFDLSTVYDPNGDVDHYVLEFMEINVPVSKRRREAMTA